MVLEVQRAANGTHHRDMNGCLTNNRAAVGLHYVWSGQEAIQMGHTVRRSKANELLNVMARIKLSRVWPWGLKVCVAERSKNRFNFRKTCPRLTLQPQQVRGAVGVVPANNRKLSPEFPQAHQNWIIEDWKKVAWCGESRFQLRHSDGRVRIWKHGPILPRINGSGSITPLSNRAPMGCAWMGPSHHWGAANKSAATAWCHHVNMFISSWHRNNCTACHAHCFFLEVQAPHFFFGWLMKRCRWASFWSRCCSRETTYVWSSRSLSDVYELTLTVLCFNGLSTADYI